MKGLTKWKQEHIICRQTDRQITRQSNFELLRIVAMVMIVFHHFAVHGGFNFDSTTLSIPRFWFNFIIMGGKTGVNIFVLISGYFLIQSKSTKASINKILKLWGQVFFYSVTIYVINIALGGGISIKQFIIAFMPMTRAAWWFASTYFVLYIIHPYLNLFLHSMDKLLYQCYLLLLLLMWCIVPTFLSTAFEGNNLCWFITLYSLAGYYRLYGFNKIVTKNAGIIAIIFTILTYCTSVIFTILGTKWAFFSEHNRYFYAAKSLPTLAISICIFVAFAKLNIKYSKWINIVSSATFGVYLIHDNRFVRPFLWKVVFHNAKFQDSILLVPYSIAVVAIVFIFCTLLDLLRQRVIERPYMQLVNRNTDKLSTVVKKVSNFFSGILFGNESMSYSE